MNTYNELRSAILNLPRRGQHNVAKIVCLALGLAMSAVIIAEVYYEQTFDQCYPDYQCICRVQERFRLNQGELMESANTSGGVGPLMQKTIPQVELATRTNVIVGNEELVLDSMDRIKASIYTADSCFFRMFPTRILEGDAVKALTAPGCCAVSRSTAERLGGRVVGRSISPGQFPRLRFTIVAVYEDYPHNSTFHDFDVIGAMSTQRNFVYDGQDNLVGNDRYQSFVRLSKGTSPGSLAKSIQAMMKTHYPMEDLKKAGCWMTYLLTPISTYYTSQPNVHQMFWILSLLAGVLLVTSVLNYVLIVVGNLITRTREMAVRKCFGAGRGIVYSLTFHEAALHLLLAVLLAAALLWACHGTIEQLLSAPLSVLIFNRGAWILAALALLVLVVGGWVPGWLYNHIPVTAAFRGYATARHRWKVLLLGVEFAGVGFLLSLLLVTGRQYELLTGYDLGYRCNDVSLVNISALSAAEKQTAAAEAARVPGVRQVSVCHDLPLYSHSGNNVSLPGQDDQLFNIADFYTVGDHYFELMEIPVVAGRTFTQGGDSLREVMVSESFARQMRKLCKWKSVVGRQVVISEHSENGRPLTIIGVYRDVHVGNATSNAVNRPSAMFYGRADHVMTQTLLLRLDHADTETLTALHDRLQRFFPGKTIMVENVENLRNNAYAPQLHFRNGVMTAGFVTLLIALVGLVGYVTDEVNHRHKEIALRKVNGAQGRDILQLFERGIMLTAVPAVVVGATGAAYVAAQWIQLFDNRITLSPWLFVGAALSVLVIVAIVVALNCRRVAWGNPAVFLQQE